MKNDRRFLIIGGGSMGKRRIRCLLANDISPSNVRLIDRREDRRAECEERYGVKSFGEIDAGWAWNPDVVIVSTPTRYHLEYCLAAARLKKDFFCEIALSDSSSGTDELHELVSDHGLVAALGINNPFHFVLRQVEAWLQDEVFGRPITYQVAYGNYLPNWHPWEHYQDFYDESQIMGVIAQELGTLYTLLDTRVCELYAQSRHSSALECEGPDNVQVLAHTTDGTSVTMQVDLLQDFQQYDYRIVGEFGVIEASLVPHPYARRYLNSTKSIEIKHPPPGYQFEQSYIDEFRCFLEALDTREEWYHPLGDGIQILRCLEALSESCRGGPVVLVSE